MYLVINKWVIAVKVSNFSGQYLRKHWTLDIGVLGYIGIVWPNEHSPEVWFVPPVKPCIEWWWTSRLWQMSHRDIRVSTDKRLMNEILWYTVSTKPVKITMLIWDWKWKKPTALYFTFLPRQISWMIWEQTKESEDRYSVIFSLVSSASAGLLPEENHFFFIFIPHPFFIFIYPFRIFIPIHHFCRAPLHFFSFASCHFSHYLSPSFLHLFRSSNPFFFPHVHYPSIMPPLLLSVLSIFILPHI